MQLIKATKSQLNGGFGRYAVLVLGLSLTGIAALAGCGSGRVSKLEETTKRDVQDLRSLQAELNASIDELRTEIRQVRGQVEELQNLATGKTAELERALVSFGSRVPPPEGVPEDLLNRDTERITRNTGAAADLYREALVKLRAGDFESALRSFRAFVDQNPDTAFSDNALFWTGVCLEKMGQYDRAIGAYNEVLQRYPAEDMVTASLYHLGDSFAKMGSYDNAALTFDKLIDEYPSDTFSSKAKVRKKEIKKTGRRN